MFVNQHMIKICFKETDSKKGTIKEEKKSKITTNKV